jgi:hypothetical protein
VHPREGILHKGKFWVPGWGLAFVLGVAQADRCKLVNVSLPNTQSIGLHMQLLSGWILTLHKSSLHKPTAKAHRKSRLQRHTATVEIGHGWSKHVRPLCTYDTSTARVS